MKIRNKLSYVWRLVAGFVLSLSGMQQSTAAISPQGNDQVGNSGNMAQPGPYGRKNHEVAFESRGGAKTKTAIGAQSDGTVYGFVTGREELAQNGRKIPSKNKSILYMQTPQRKDMRGKMLESRPARGAKAGLIVHKPAARKSHPIAGKPDQGKSKSFVDKPAQGKMKPIRSMPRRGIQPGKNRGFIEQPVKRRLIMNSPRRGMQPGKGQMLESRPGKSKAFIDGKQGRLDFDGIFPFTDEQKEYLIFGSRDYRWELNDDGLLERHLPDGIRVVIREQGMVEVFDAENQSMGRFHSPAAWKMDRALRITQDMKERVREDGRSLG